MIPVLFLNTIPFVVVSQWPSVHWFSASDRSALVHDRGPQHGVRSGLYNGNNPDGSISTTVYRKATHTDRYLNFKSHHLLARKLAVVKHCTAGQEQSAQTSLLRTKRPGTSGRPSSTTGTVVTLPSVCRLSEVVQWVLAPLGVRVSFRPNTTLRQLLVRPKDRVPTEEQTGVVYQVLCVRCLYRPEK